MIIQGSLRNVISGSVYLFLMFFVNFVFAEDIDVKKLAKGWKMVAIVSESCPVCHKWRQEVNDRWKIEAFSRYMFDDNEQKAVYDIEDDDDQEKIQALIAQSGVLAPVLVMPSFLFFDPNGREHFNMRINGYKDVEDFKSTLEQKLPLSHR